MTEHKIPFNRPSLCGNELRYIAQAVEYGHVSGDGAFSKECQTLLEQLLGVPKVFLTPSGTHALEMTALLLTMKPGDEVIFPSFAFVSTVNAFVLHGAHPVFIDIRPDTLNMDEAHLERLITPRTRAVVPVHYAGVGCELDPILEVAGRHGVMVIEDNAHGLFGKYKDRYLGTFGCLSILSFHETKNLTCGEGGSLIINDPKYIERAEIIRERGTNRSDYFRGQVEAYTWVDRGSNYFLSDILSAFLYAQLEARESIQMMRRRIWDNYYNHLEDWAQSQDVRMPMVPDHCEQSCHMFYLLMPTMNMRQDFIEHLMARGILSVFHYQPLHLSAMGRLFSGKEGDCPVSEDVSNRLVRIPFYTALTEDEQAFVVDAICEFGG